MHRALFAFLFLPGLAFAAPGGGPSYTPGTLTAAQVGAVKATDFPNPITYGADPTGVADSYSAFNTAAALVPTGSDIRLHVTPGTYRMGTTFTGNSRNVTFLEEPGVTFTGASPPTYVTRFETSLKGSVITNVTGQGSSSTVAIIGDSSYVGNNGNNAGIGKYYAYNNYNTVSNNTNGGDIGYQIVSTWSQLSGTELFNNWEIGVSPLFSQTDITGGTNFGLIDKEINPVNNSPDTPWTEFDSSQSGTGIGVPANWAAGIQLVPETWSPTGGYGGNIEFGFAVFPGAVNNRTATNSNPHAPLSATGPYRIGTNTPLLLGNRSTAPGGRAIYVGGDTDSVTANYPYAPMEIRHQWQSGIHLELSSLLDNSALFMSSSQTIGWGTTGSPQVTLGASGPNLVINPGAAGVNGGVYYTTSNSNRWFLGRNADAETGSNNGSNLVFYMYSDTGAYLGNAMQIQRNNGAVYMYNALTVSGQMQSGTIYDNGQLTVGGASYFTGPLYGAGTDLTIGLNGGGGRGVLIEGATYDQSGAQTAPTTGGSETYPTNASDRFLDPAGTIATFSETLPASPKNGLIVHIGCGQTITALTVTANTGQTLRPATSGTGQSVTTTCSATQSRQFRYHLAQTAWTQDY